MTRHRTVNVDVQVVTPSRDDETFVREDEVRGIGDGGRDSMRRDAMDERTVVPDGPVVVIARASSRRDDDGTAMTMKMVMTRRAETDVRPTTARRTTVGWCRARASIAKVDASRAVVDGMGTVGRPRARSIKFTFIHGGGKRRRRTRQEDWANGRVETSRLVTRDA